MRRVLHSLWIAQTCAAVSIPPVGDWASGGAPTRAPARRVPGHSPALSACAVAVACLVATSPTAL
jgi:hypothetical protein